MHSIRHNSSLSTPHLPLAETTPAGKVVKSLRWKPINKDLPEHGPHPIDYKWDQSVASDLVAFLQPFSVYFYSIFDWIF